MFINSNRYVCTEANAKNVRHSRIRCMFTLTTETQKVVPVSAAA
jgi:hypothetical protein